MLNELLFDQTVKALAYELVTLFENDKWLVSLRLIASKLCFVNITVSKNICFLAEGNENSNYGHLGL